MKILVIQTAFIGDVVLATGILESLHTTFPKAKIDLLVQKGNEVLFHDHPFVHEVYLLDKKSNKYRNIFKLVKQIRKRKYFYLVNIHRFFSSGLITAFSGAKTKIGFDKNPWSFAFTNKIEHQISDTGKQHEYVRNFKLIDHIFGAQLKKPKLYPPKERLDLQPVKKYICLAPASVWFTKQWPESKWIELTSKIPLEYDVLLIGGPKEKSLCERIQQTADRDAVEVLAGKLSLMESVQLIRDAAWVISNDSAPMHFASAVNTPICAIFCSTVPEFGFGPLSDHSIIIQTGNKLDCRPCGLHGKSACPEGHFKCAEIDVNLVMKQCELI